MSSAVWPAHPLPLFPSKSNTHGIMGYEEGEDISSLLILTPLSFSSS